MALQKRVMLSIPFTPRFHVMLLLRPNSDTHDYPMESLPGNDPGSRIQKCVATAILCHTIKSFEVTS